MLRRNQMMYGNKDTLPRIFRTDFHKSSLFSIPLLNKNSICFLTTRDGSEILLS